MTESERFKRWSPSESDLKDMNPVKARDLIIKCFFEAQQETFARSRQQLGLQSNEKETQGSIVSAIKLVMREVGGDFDNPTKESLMKAVDVLGRKASSWGTPDDITGHHKEQIRKVLTLLK